MTFSTKKKQSEREKTTTSFKSPYPGLRPFSVSESALFFGRDRQSLRMIMTLAQNHFLAVVGTSGCGKSSLVKAGLLPALRNPDSCIGVPNREWVYVVTRPGGGPFRNLAMELTRQCPQLNAIQDSIDLERRLRAGTDGLVDAIYSVSGMASRNVLVVIDQFEEIFRFGDTSRRTVGQLERSQQHNDALAFVDTLLSAARAQNPQIFVAITMRSDSLGRCDLFHGLPEAITRSQFLPPRLSKVELLDAIRRPLALFDSTIDDAVVADLLEAMGDRQDQLPVIQHALAQLWCYASEGKSPGEPRQITTEHAERCGAVPDSSLPTGDRLSWVTDAISTHADFVYDSLANSVNGPRPATEAVQRKLIARSLFCALSQIDDNQEPQRRLTTSDEVAGIVFGKNASEAQIHETESVVRAFAEDGHDFVFQSTMVDGTQTLDVSHECLLRQWKMLQKWLTEEGHWADDYRNLCYLAKSWRNDPERLLKPPRLDEAVAWRETVHPTEEWSRRYNSDFALCMSFLDACVEATKQAKERRVVQASPSSMLSSTTAKSTGSHSFLESLQTAIVNALVGRLYQYDFFISYSWRDGRIYAMSLARAFDVQDFTYFIDTEQYSSGDNWLSEQQRSLERSQRLLLICTPDALQSQNVVHEIERSKALGRQVIPIVFSSPSTPRDERLLNELLGSNVTYIVESPQNLDCGASSNVLNKIQESFKTARVHERRIRMLISAATVLGVMTSVSFGLLFFAAYLLQASYADREATIQSRKSVEIALLHQLEAYTHPTSVCGQIAAYSTQTNSVDEVRKQMNLAFKSFQSSDQIVVTNDAIQKRLAELKLAIDLWNPTDEQLAENLRQATLAVADEYQAIWRQQSDRLPDASKKIVASMIARPIYEDAIKVTKRLTNNPETRSIREEFEQLYWGKLVLFETAPVEAAMIDFRLAIQKKDSLQLVAVQLENAVTKALKDLP